MKANYKHYSLIFIILVCTPNVLFSQVSYEQWPTKEWTRTTPEAQGIDSEKLIQMLDTIQSKSYSIRHISIVRNGCLVLSTNFYPFPEDTWHIINSCTKSIVSVLFGIAIEQGYVKSVEEPLLQIFPEINPRNIDNRKQNIAIKHLLSMSSGLNTQDSYFHGFQGLNNMTRSDNWVQYVLDLPMDCKPGEKFEYSNCSSFLLTAILHQYIKKDIFEFANETLFEPLGINEVDWWRGYQGMPLGWAGIRMKPLDLAKIGLLYLNKGNWNGKQIVSSNWVDASTKRHIDTGEFYGNIFMEGYGYHWWIDDLGNYAAIGFGGQYLIISPENDLIVVFNSALETKDFAVPRELFKEYILPACHASHPIANNVNAEERLEAIQKKVTSPNPSSSQILPPIAKLISAKTFTFDPNPSSFRTLSITFDDSSKEAKLSLAFGPKQIDVNVGLDDNFRITQAAGYLRAYKGNWEDDSTFVINYHVLDYSERGKLIITFENENQIEGRIYEYVENVNHKIAGRITN